MISDFIRRALHKSRKVLTITDKADAVMIITALILLAYTTIMAIVSDITYDEAWTYMHYSLPNTPGFLDIDIANNHPLNSFLVYISSFLFPYNELAIRLPNLIFLILYLIVSISISKKFGGLKIIIFGGLVLYWTIVPFYFSLGRGYGMATALVLLFLNRFLDSDHNERAIITNFYILTAATYSFVGLLPLVASAGIFYLFFIIKKDFYNFLKKFAFDIVFLTINFTFLVYYLISVTAEGKPLPGGGINNDTFLASTIGYYLESYFSFIPEIDHHFLLIIAVIGIVLSLIIILKNNKRKNVLLVTILTFFAFYLSGTFLNKPFVTGRVLIPFYPLLAISIATIVNSAINHFKLNQKYLPYIGCLLFAILTLNYSFQIKLKNNELEFKNLVLEKNDIESTKWHPSLTFYKNKFFSNLLKQPPSINEEVAEGMTLLYFKKINVILFKVKPDKIVNSRFYLYVYPDDINSLPEQRKKYEFDKLEFNWFGYEKDGYKYIMKKLPDYQIKSFKIGQKINNTWPWSKTVVINEVKGEH